MSSWIVSPPAATDWKLARDALIEALMRDWPGVDVSGPDPELPTEDVVWSIRDELGVLEGSQDREGTGQYLDGPIQLVMNYVVWLRGIVPTTVDLVLYDDMYSTAAALVPGMSGADVMAALTPP